MLSDPKTVSFGHDGSLAQNAEYNAAAARLQLDVTATMQPVANALAGSSDREAAPADAVRWLRPCQLPLTAAIPVCLRSRAHCPMVG